MVKKADQKTIEPAQAIKQIEGLLTRPKMHMFKVKLYEEYVQFLRDYHAMFEIAEDFDTFLMRLIYSKADQLYRDLVEFAAKRDSIVPECAVFNKWTHMALMASPQKDES